MTSTKIDSINRYDIMLVDIPEQENSHVQHGFRPAVVVSNNKANLYSPIVSVVPLTTNLQKSSLPTHVLLTGGDVEKDSLALCEHVMPLDKRCLVRKVGVLHSAAQKTAINRALSVQLGLVA